MQNPFKRADPHEFDEAISACLAEMQAYGPGSEEYLKAYETLKGLTAMRELRKSGRISPDMVALCVTNLIGIGLIALLEAKGYSFLTKAKDHTLKLRT